jgi:hypothetical protein
MSDGPSPHQLAREDKISAGQVREQPPHGLRQSKSSPPLGNLAKSPASWQRKAATPLRSICSRRMRDIVIAPALQSYGIGTVFSNPSR